MTLLPPESINVFLVDNPEWVLDGDSLVSVRTFEDFAAAIAFVVRVALIAERAFHHPDIDVRWNTVTLRLSTHSAGGLTSQDLDLAAQI